MAGRKILLLLDGAKVHSTANLNLCNTKVYTLPPYTTSCIQPMDAGIIMSFKHHYQSYFIKWLLDKYEAEKDEKINVLNAIRFIAQAWRKVTPETIRNCFQHTGILPNTQDNEKSFVDDNDDELIDKLYLDIKTLNFQNIMDLEEYIDYPGEKDTHEVLSDKEILDLAINLEPENESAEDDDSTKMRQISHQEALNAVEILDQYIVQNDFVK
ncbi:22071_t:CDS:1 [Cetraspora pellucida]|uniref:22071_t:CDS:1 n=1 Tax=Cetraspora pellucida TaxID=1433469 RepID=A0A9N9IDV3_9GLOM|nr:22071_t:CDS:1 [Cetraspora pellucida]